MNYQETLDWMFNQLPMYQHVGQSAYKKDLTNTVLLSEHLNNPHHDLVCIHVAGTNGKGSTSHLLASVLQEAGYKVGLYTSPHLKDFRERIKINGLEIPEEEVVAFIATHRNFFETNDLSFFEMTVGLAFQYFKKQQVDVAVIEVGMGGRLDSTNIIHPILSIITNIDLDHTAFLGNTLAAIATEKAGIIKHQVPVVIGTYTPETKAVFEQKGTENHATLYWASDALYTELPCALKGDYQTENKKTVLQAIAVLKNTLNIQEQHIHNGFLNVIQQTGLQGRWQQLGSHPTIICDTAHNKHGLKSTMKQLQNLVFEQLHIVLGVVNDKNLDAILPLFPKNAIYYFCKPNLPRGLDALTLQQTAKQHHLEGSIYYSVSEAYNQAQQNAQQNDCIYVGGSTFVVAEIL